MRKFKIFLTLFFVLILLVSCGRQRTACFSYSSTPVEGWEQHNVLSFPIDSIESGGEYELSVGARTTYDYPFQTLWLEVTTHFEHPRMDFLDTLVCQVTDLQGNILGRGISVFQYVYPLKALRLNIGQKGVVTIKHIMRRNILPGVSDIGVILRRKSS